MKTKLVCLAIIVIGLNSVMAQVGIGTTTPNASAALEVKSTSQGFLPPRMTAAQRDAISTPVQGLIVYCTNCGTNGETQSYNGASWVNLVGGVATAGLACGYTVTFNYNGSSVTYGTVTGAGSKCWLDRNLGASQVANAFNDYLAYGDFYQWGRAADGHQTIVWSSSTSSDGSEQTQQTSTLSSLDQPGHGDFIFVGNTGIRDWRSPQNDNLWQGVNGVNNPCPSGYRLPTEAELDTERLSWSNLNRTGAFASPLKLPSAGYRDPTNGSLDSANSNGYYWTSTVSSTNSKFLYFFSSNALMSSGSVRAYGVSVRCIKHED